MAGRALISGLELQSLVPHVLTSGKLVGKSFCIEPVAMSHKLARPAAFRIDCLMTDLSEAQEAVHQTLLVVVVQTGKQFKRQAMFPMFR